MGKNKVVNLIECTFCRLGLADVRWMFASYRPDVFICDKCGETVARMVRENERLEAEEARRG